MVEEHRENIDPMCSHSNLIYNSTQSIYNNEADHQRRTENRAPSRIAGARWSRLRYNAALEFCGPKLGFSASRSDLRFLTLCPPCSGSQMAIRTAAFLPRSSGFAAVSEHLFRACSKIESRYLSHHPPYDCDPRRFIVNKLEGAPR
jgi:hypothetical protein